MDIIQGFQKYPDLYPNPPVPVEELQKDVDEFLKRQKASLIAHASAKKATEFKNDGMKPVKEKTKQK